MAVDKLVDSTQLDADLTSVANAIRTKGGTSAQMAFPSGFVSAVNAIPQGDENIAKLAGPSGSLNYRWTYGIFEENEEFSVDISSIIYRDTYNRITTPSLQSAFLDARNLRTIEIKNLQIGVTGPKTVAMASFCEHDSYYGQFGENLEEVKITTSGGGNTISPSGTISAFSARRKLRVIDCIFDMSQIASYDSGYNFRNMFGQCEALEEVRFVPNSLLWMNTKYQIFNVSQVLSDASLVSIANALAVGSTAPNIKLLSTPYARCSTLMGTVTDGLFTQDDVSGTVSLADFIANTKGWTLST